MQGSECGQRDLLDVESWAGHLLPVGSVFAFLAEHRGELFAGEDFADLFPSRRGRPSVPPSVAASVLLLQTLYNVSDREAVEALTFDLRWKAACGFAIDAAGFHPSTLTYWRRRLAGSDRPQRINEAVGRVVAATGVLAGRGRRVLDSTVLDDAVARQDTITQLVAQVRRVGRLVPGAGVLVPVVCTRMGALTGQGYDAPGKPPIAWDDEDAKNDLVSALVGDALALIEALDLEVIGAQGGQAADAVALLALVAGQDVEPAEDSDGTDGRFRIARRVAKDRVISTVDPEARHAHKSVQRKQDGYKAHIAVEPETGIITASEVTKASGPDSGDAVTGIRLLEADHTLPSTSPSAGVDVSGSGQSEPSVEVLGDSAYGTGPMLAALEEAGYVPLIKPWPLQPAVPGGFTIDDFTPGPGGGTLTCPAGITRKISPNGTATFGAACRGCPLMAQCTTATAGRSVKLNPNDALQRAHRQRASDPAFQATYREQRPMVERSIAWLTRSTRKLRYRGVAKNNAWLHTRTAALNLRRLLNLGLTRTNGTWAIA